MLTRRYVDYGNGSLGYCHRLWYIESRSSDEQLSDMIFLKPPR